MALVTVPRCCGHPSTQHHHLPVPGASWGSCPFRELSVAVQHPSDFWDPAPLTGLPEGWWEVVALEQRDVGGCQALATVCVGTQQQQS